MTMENQVKTIKIPYKCTTFYTGEGGNVLDREVPVSVIQENHIILVEIPEGEVEVVEGKPGELIKVLPMSVKINTASKTFTVEEVGD